MEWSDLAVFLAIAREGTLSAAARRLGQTQPTMGRRLRALETAVGQRLFQRTAEGFLLTDEGRSVLAHAERVEEEVLSFERTLAGGEQQLSGVLRITSSDWFGAHVLAPLCAEFTRGHPHMTLELLTDARLYSLSRREADFAFRITPFDEPDIVSRKLLHMPYALYGRCGQEHPLPGDGKGFDVITMDMVFDNLPDVAWLKRMLPNAHVACRSNNRDVQATLCAHAGGLAVLPCLLGDKTPGIERLDMGEAPPGRDTWIGYHRDLRQSARLRGWLELVMARLGNTT